MPGKKKSRKAYALAELYFGERPARTPCTPCFQSLRGSEDFTTPPGSVTRILAGQITLYLLFVDPVARFPQF
jgi:hypothetical protein